MKILANLALVLVLLASIVYVAVCSGISWFLAVFPAWGSLMGLIALNTDWITHDDTILSPDIAALADELELELISVRKD